MNYLVRKRKDETEEKVEKTVACQGDKAMMRSVIHHTKRWNEVRDKKGGGATDRNIRVIFIRIEKMHFSLSLVSKIFLDLIKE